MTHPPFQLGEAEIPGRRTKASPVSGKAICAGPGPRDVGDGMRAQLLGRSTLYAIKTWVTTGGNFSTQFSHPSFRENQHPNPPVDSNFSMAGDGGNSPSRSLRHQQPPIERSRLTLHCPLPKINRFQNTVGKCWEPSGQVWMNQPMATLETPNGNPKLQVVNKNQQMQGVTVMFFSCHCYQCEQHIIQPAWRAGAEIEALVAVPSAWDLIGGLSHYL